MTFDKELGEVALVPGTGVVFEVRVDEALVWLKKDEGRFPESRVLKQGICDRIAPAKDPGLSDRQPYSNA